MFVENYRLENAESIMAGGEARPIPYPKISDEDWRVWNFFLPVRAESFDTKLALDLKAHHLYRLHGIPEQVATEIQRGTKYFDRFEVWRKREDRDPIAVGYQGNDRYLIARWGMEKLVPFETIKESMPLVLAWKYGIDALGALAGLAGNTNYGNMRACFAGLCPKRWPGLREAKKRGVLRRFGSRRLRTATTIADELSDFGAEARELFGSLEHSSPGRTALYLFQHFRPQR